MDRRAFLKSLFTAGVLVAVNPDIALEQLLTETQPMSDTDFVTYIRYTMNMYVQNPAHCFVITNISEEGLE